MCTKDLESYCPEHLITFGSIYYDRTKTYGGFSDIMVVDDHFALVWPEKLPLDAGCPLLCAGITTYSPLRYFGLNKPGIHVGVVGLGHVAVKLAKAFGAKVTVISTSSNKRKEALEKLGVMNSYSAATQSRCRLQLVQWMEFVDTVSAVHTIHPLIDLLVSHGKLIMAGTPVEPLELPIFPLSIGRKIVAGTAVGGLKETQEMLDFAAKHNILADVEVVPIDYVNNAFDRLERGDVKYRFVIDIGFSNE